MKPITEKIIEESIIENKMKGIINELFKFLNENRRFNSAFQNNYWNSILTPYNSSKEKAYSLLHNIFFTQSQAKLDKAKIYFESIHNDKNALKSFKSFCHFNHVDDLKQPYKSLFDAMQKQGGWGKKTSALFIKNLFQIHHHSKQTNLRFWDVVPSLKKSDRIYLPVDIVITDIFHHIDSSLKSFDKINNYIHQNEEWKNNFVWDDLWFWGYFTQKGSKSPRKLVFNEPKYWSQLHFNKDKKVIAEIKLKSNQFISILKSK